MFTDITPEIILDAYAQGIFPMAESADSIFFNFYRPEMRGQLSIDNIHISKKLLKKLKNNPYNVTINTAFEQVIDHCAERTKTRPSTWINKPIRDVFVKLHYLGFAHSVECWHEEQLVGGLYGLALGAVFCGESMFSTMDDASKIALIHLCARLSKGAYTVLDTQFTNEHLEQFAIYEIPQEEYETLIQSEMKKRADFLLKDLDEDKIMKEYLDKRTD